MRRTASLLLASLALVAALGACSDDDDGEGGGDGAATTSDQISTTGICARVDVDAASEALGVAFDKAVDAEGTCTVTSSTAQTAFTLQVSSQGTDDTDLVLETLGATCDQGSRQEQALAGAEGAFRCLAGGVPHVVAVADGELLVLTGNSREESVATDTVLAGLVTILEGVVAAEPES